MVKGTKGYHGKRDQMYIMGKGTRCISCEKGPDVYYGGEKGLEVYCGERDQSCIMGKEPKEKRLDVFRWKMYQRKGVKNGLRCIM